MNRGISIATALLLLMVLSLPTVASAETAKELVVSACYNARQQLEHKTLWSSRILRRAGGHTYLEQEIESVDGRVRRLVSVDGHEPSRLERKQDDERLRDLEQNPNARLALKKESEAERKKFNDLLQVIPNLFLFEDQGNQEGLEKLAFRPNPAYVPKTYVERALHAMSGVILMNLQEKRLAGVSATVTKQVDFGYGLFGHLNQGGSVDIKRIRVAPGIWKTSSSKIDIGGRFIIFKTISQQKDEVESDFKPVSPDTSILKAVHLLRGETR